MRCPARSGCGEGVAGGWFLTGSLHDERGERSLWSLFYEITNPIQESSASMTYSPSSDLSPSPILILSSHKKRTSTCELRENVSIQTIATLFSRKDIASAFWGPVSTSVLEAMSQTMLRSSVLLD